MARCFCGCGRRVSLFPLRVRSLNKRGRLISSDVERISRPPLSGEDEEFLEDARWLTGALADCVHRGVVPRLEAHTAEVLRMAPRRLREKDWRRGLLVSSAGGADPLACSAP